MNNTIKFYTILSLVIASIAMTGCGGSGSGGGGSVPNNNPDPNPPPKNVAPAITGAPSINVTAGQTYSFTPTATDANGDSLTFSISNKPAWATFSTVSGKLTGSPVNSDANTYSNIIISVSDGIATTALTSFNITVSQAAATRNVTISWNAPTLYADGTTIGPGEIGGFRVYQGTSLNNLSVVVDVNNPNTLSFQFTSLVSGSYFFAITAYNSAGVESSLSGTVNVNI